MRKKRPKTKQGEPSMFPIYERVFENRSSRASRKYLVQRYVPIGGMSTRDHCALEILKAMVESAPLCDRTKINKRKWVRIAFEWADLVLVASKS